MIPAKYWSPTKKLMLLGAMAGGKLVEDTASGNPLTFFTDKAKPLKSLLIPFTPQQEGTGDPSPQNVRPIVPWNGLKVFGSGQNIITNGFTNGVLDLNTGAKSTNPNYITSEYIPVVPLKSYYFKCPTIVSSELDICYYDKDKHYIGYADAEGYVSCNAPGRSRKTPAGCYYVRIDARNAQYNNDICINYPASVTGYVPAVGVTETDIVFSSPVYGGTLDVVSGVLTVEWAGFSATWGDGESATDMGSGITRKVYPMVDYLTTGFANNMCNIAQYQASENATVHFYYSGSGSTNRKCRLFLPSDTPDTTVVTVITKLSQTYEVQLAGAQITALVGDNTIWSDANGQMTAVYLKKG